MLEVREVIERAGVIQTGHFVFANGDHAQVKLEMDQLWEHPDKLQVILELLALAEGLPMADLIVGVPTGGQRLAMKLVNDGLVPLPIAELERVPGGTKQDFRFKSAADERLAWQARSIRIIEDVVTTLSSVAGVVKLLDPSKQTIHSLAIWRRGTVQAKYSHGVTDHYLVEEIIPSFPANDCPDPNCPNHPPS